MNQAKITEAVKHAREFIKRADAVVANVRNYEGSYYSSKETGALRRQSMELTRALSSLRSYKD